jgi:hypothetical protein
MYLKDNITLREERGNTFIMCLKEGRKGDCRDAENSRKDSGTSEETMPVDIVNTIVWGNNKIISGPGDDLYITGNSSVVNYLILILETLTAHTMTTVQISIILILSSKMNRAETIISLNLRH